MTGAVAPVVPLLFQQTVKVLPSRQNARYLQVTVGDSTNPDNFLRVGLAFAGTLWTPGNNFAYGATNGFQNDSDVPVTRGR